MTMMGYVPPEKLAGDTGGLMRIASKTPKIRQGFFSPGGAGRNIAGSIGDFLLQYAGGRPIFAPALENRLRQRMQEAEFERRQQAERDQFLFEQNYRRENPLPTSNDTVADFEFIRSRLGEEAAESYLRNKTLPPMVGVDIQNPDGSVTRQFYPRGTIPGGSAPQGFDALPPGFVVEDGGAGPSNASPTFP